MELYQNDILIIGSLVDNDLILAEHLTRKGLKCSVARKKQNIKTGTVPAGHYHQVFKPDQITYFKNEFEFYDMAKKARLIISLTGSLVYALARLWPLRRILHLPPIINITTGSDITELSVQHTLSGWLYRQYLNYVDLNWCANYPNAIKNVFELKIPNIVFMRYPYYLFKNSPESEPLSKPEMLRFFHPSNLDWKASDNSYGRNSSKGNDRFIRAFARAIKTGLNGYCVILDRGSDKEIAKELIEQLDVKEFFIWKEHLDRNELIEEYKKADVVVDQFDIGGLGGIAVEAMSLAKPVMIYLNEQCQRLHYSRLAPVLQCSSEDEIFQQIMKCQDEEYLKVLGEQAQEWIYENHYYETCLDQLIFYYSLLTGHRILDYGFSS